MNLGVGFTIPEERLHQDMYFPSFTQLPKPVIPPIVPGAGPIFIDSVIALGGFPGATDAWANLKKAMRFHRIGQHQLRDLQIEKMLEGWEQTDKSIENAMYIFLARLLGGGKPEPILGPLVEQLQYAIKTNRPEFVRFLSHYEADLKSERFENYIEVISEYFNSYEEFNQTAVYARHDMPLPDGSIASSTAFESTRMFYGNAFEILGSHLDVVAAVNNICSGRAYDQMLTMDLKKYRGLNKASRTKCISDNPAFAWLVQEYDSQVRNASHHRWFRIDDAKRYISYRSGGSGAIHKMSYAEYLYRCSRIFFRICAMACWEIVMLHMTRRGL